MSDMDTSGLRGCAVWAAAAGGGEAGRAAVVDTVAFTWFNRMIALPFMDANGYSGVGVVSPQAGVAVGQPEILADAKRGVLDSEVVSARTDQTVMALLDGTRHSPDPQGEAYRLLLAGFVKANYPNLGKVLNEIPDLEANQ